jgi:purine-binding chemotaxis protein CheW
MMRQMSFASPAVPSARALLCRVAGRLCAIPLAHVVETMRPLPVTGFADLPSFVLGVAVIRGEPTPVVALGHLLGAAGGGDPTRFVTIRAGARTVALGVDEVAGIRDLTAVPTTDLPPLLREASAEVLARLGALDSELLVVLRSATWIPESLWEAAS